MKRFIIKTLLVFIPFLLAFSAVCFVIAKQKYKIIPFVCSVSFDSKLYELKQKGFETIDNIAVGSSMTLNNLNTSVCLKYFNGESFYNVSSWGQGIDFDRDMIKILVERYTPKRIIMVTFANDFHEGNLDFKKNIETYLYTDCFDYLFMVGHKINTKFYDSDEDYSNHKRETNDYANLNYDECGGVELNVYADDISPTRWNETSSFKFDRDNNCYKSLIEICEFLQNNNVDLLFINTPTRRHYYCNNLNDVEMHINLCDSIITSYGFFYSNEMDFKLFDDSLFTDHAHLNAQGSKMFTDKFLHEYFENARIHRNKFYNHTSKHQ